MSDLLLALLLITLPLLSPLRGDVAYMLRKAWPGSVLARVTAAVTMRPAGPYQRISVIDAMALVAIAMAIAMGLLTATAMTLPVELATDPGAYTTRLPLVVLAAMAVPILLLMAFDLRYRVLPDMLTLPTAALGLLAAALTSDYTGLDWQTAAMGCFGAGAALWLLQHGFRWLRGIDGLGGGDVKLAAAMGAWLGPIGCAFAIAVAALGALVVEVAIGLVRHGRIDPKRRIPFGAYLCGAFWLALCAGIAG
jgi:prepilin signal peptidase PulO-like enzyme (type II secretory pathway)